MESCTSKEALSKKTKDELIEMVLKLLQTRKLAANHDYIFIDAVARQGSHIGIPTLSLRAKH